MPEEALHALTEGHGAVTHLRPGALRFGLRGLARFLGLLTGLFAALLDRRARELGALDDGLADALGGLLDALADLARADLLGAGLHLLGGGLYFRVVRPEGFRGQDEEEHTDEHQRRSAPPRTRYPNSPRRPPLLAATSVS